MNATREDIKAAHEEEMVRIVTRFYAACTAPTRRFRRALCALSLSSALVMIVVAIGLIDPMVRPAVFFGLSGMSFLLLALSVRLALNDLRDVRQHYRRSRRDLFVSTFSDEEFQRKVRAKRAKVRAKLEASKSTDG